MCWVEGFPIDIRYMSFTHIVLVAVYTYTEGICGGLFLGGNSILPPAARLRVSK